MGSAAVVIGAGIGGLSAAVGLRKAGWAVTVFEQAPEFRALGAGISLWPNALHALDELGMGDAVAPHLRAQSAGGLRDPHGRWLTRWDGHELERRVGKPLAGARRASLIATLRAALPESSVRTGVRVSSVDTDGTVHGPDGLLARSDLVVGADGINSVVRGSVVSTSAVPSFSGETAFRAITDATGQSDLGTAWGPGVEVGIVPLTEGKLYWWASFAVTRPMQGVEPHSFLRARFRDWSADMRGLVDQLEPETILHHDIDVLPEQLESYSYGRVALLGDAAHAMTPFLGQGGCQAIEDAVVLAAHLARCGR